MQRRRAPKAGRRYQVEAGLSHLLRAGAALFDVDSAMLPSTRKKKLLILRFNFTSTLEYHKARLLLTSVFRNNHSSSLLIRGINYEIRSKPLL